MVLNADALSDLVLLLVCAVITWRLARTRPAVAAGAALIGLAAGLGVLRFSGWSELLPGHRLASLLAACAAFPLWAVGLGWPDGPLAKRPSAVAAFALVAGAVGVGLSSAGVGAWSQVVPGVSALAIAWAAARWGKPAGIAGAMLLIGSFVVAATGKPDSVYLGFFNGTQALHYLLAAGLALLTVPMHGERA